MGESLGGAHQEQTNTGPWLVPARREHRPGRWLEEKLLLLPGVARGPGFQGPSTYHGGKLESCVREPGSAWERLGTYSLERGVSATQEAKEAGP